MPKVAYSAVVLKHFAQTYLRKRMSPILDELRCHGFVEQNARGQQLSHHMTLCMGACSEKLSKYVGKNAMLQVDAWGKTDKAIAVRVVPFNLLDLTKVTNPHITVAVNPTQGGAPKDSNQITEWTPFDQIILLEGIVEEVSH